MNQRARNYVVAGTPRSGSSLLCEGLEQSGVAGHPAEVFAPDFRGPWFDRWGLTRDAAFADYLTEARRYGTGRNGVYGVKIQYMHVQVLAQLASFPGDCDDVLEFLFPHARYVNIVRRDRRAQALSWFRAIRTNEWARTDEGSNATPPSLDAEAVHELEMHLQQQQLHWDHYFETHRITPIVVEYESLANDYRGEVGRVLRCLGLDGAVAQDIPPPQLRRQADDVSLHWREQMETLPPSKLLGR